MNMMRHIFLPVGLLLVGLLLVACGSSALRAPELWDDESYYPRGQLYPDLEELDGWLRRYYSNVLRYMGEPPLARRSASQGPTLRFLYLPSFDSAICVSIQPTNMGAQVLMTMLRVEDALWNPKATSACRRSKSTISMATWKGIQMKLSDRQVWLPRGLTEDEMMTYDGAGWVLEYHDGKSWRQGAAQ